MHGGAAKGACRRNEIEETPDRDRVQDRRNRHKNNKIKRFPSESGRLASVADIRRGGADRTAAPAWLIKPAGGSTHGTGGRSSSGLVTDAGPSAAGLVLGLPFGGGRQHLEGGVVFPAHGDD